MLEVIILGFVQGLTEFLPVSSSGHLTLVQVFFNWKNPETNLVFDIILHFGTLLAVIWFFRKDLLPYFTISGWKDPTRRRLALMVVAASVPTAAIGIGFKKTFEAMFASPPTVCLFLMVTAILLFIADKFAKRGETCDIQTISPLKAIIVGIFQGIAVAPGISRSGATISSGIFCGLSGVESARFSFLLMIPAVGGATLLEAKKIFVSGLPADINLEMAIVGGIVAMITGFMALRFLMAFLKEQRLRYFSYYLAIVSSCSWVALTFFRS
ncbi:undecaprenyl-diphosphate phosphatase [bacterium]|nr:undecaprenyl-diphosphate phosphatase [bacterium]